MRMLGRPGEPVDVAPFTRSRWAIDADRTHSRVVVLQSNAHYARYAGFPGTASNRIRDAMNELRRGHEQGYWRRVC